MAEKRNFVARDPILRKGGAHVKSKSGQRHRAKHTLSDEVEAYLEERHTAPCKGRGRPSRSFLSRNSFGLGAVLN